MMKNQNLILFLFIVISGIVSAQKVNTKSGNDAICSTQKLDSLLMKPQCLEGYLTNQSGPLSKLDSSGKETTDSTFIVEQIKVPSNGVMIHGWLYLPLDEGKHPLVILTNGGGNNSARIKSMSDFLAPILAHCGIAAFVHDKRGTGKSEGSFVGSTYDDFVADAGNCAVFLSKDSRIDSAKIGIIGGSEGGIIAYLAANRYPVIKFVISLAGTFVSSVDDRMNAQKGWLQGLNLDDTAYTEVLMLHEKSIRAWASKDSAQHEKVNKEILEARKKYDISILPYMKSEMDSIPEFAEVLPTWYSLPNDYMTEMKKFRKKWLAIFGEVDKVVPTDESIKNIIEYMAASGNSDYSIVVLPKCGHAPVNVETKRMVRFDNIILNWLNENGIN